MAQVVDVFIASPSDVQTERDHAEQAIRLISQRTRDLLGIVLNAVTWQKFLPSQARSFETRVQDRFTTQVRKCGIFIGILGERYGTEIDESRRISGTDEEFNEAIKFRNDIEILTYFKTIPQTVSSSAANVKQLARVQDLQQRLKDQDLLCQQYSTPDQFRERVLLDLFEAVLRIRTEAERREQYLSFFRFGVGKSQDSPSVLVAYPPIHKHVQQATQGDGPANVSRSRLYKYNWQERLLPNVVYEDVKCIEKLESAIRLTGVQDISAVTIDHPKMFMALGNRIWLCLPRNDMASRRLAKLRSRAWFSFERRQQEDRPRIVWKQPGTKEKLEIQSPMRQYLEIQNRPRRSPWEPNFGAIVARDYAVIGRFAGIDSRGHTRGEPYYHYFVAGIRGLGTWGAGWYIDRKAYELQQLARNAEKTGADAQVLLEVTYSSFRIVSVEDVSSKGQEYFNSQHAPRTIDSVIEEFKM